MVWKQMKRLFALAALTAAACAAPGCSGSRERGAPAKIDTSTMGVALKVDATAIKDPGAIARAAARVEPSVVTIDTEYRRPRRYGVGDFMGFDRGPERVPLGSGSGVIISADGYIVTNNHVVQNAARINVTLENGREMEGRVLGADAQTDIAVVKVEEKNLPAIVLADSDKVKVGEWVVAVGNPMRVGTTVTAGIVSAIRKGKDLPGGSNSLAAAIQTDAAINPGNSGGALADIEGRLIGINTAIISNNGGSIGLGFAIPVNAVRDVVGQLIAHGKIARPWLGVAFDTVSDRAREALGIPESVSGIFVGEVISGSPAEEVGLQPGDIIQRADGKEIKSTADFQTVMQSAKIGEKMSLRVWRQGASNDVSLTLGERPATPIQPE